MNVNDLIVQGAEPLFFLDYLGLHKQRYPSTPTAIVEGVARGCDLAGCALLGGETRGDARHLRRGRLRPGRALPSVSYQLRRAVDPMRVEAGDLVIGLASSGVHSNGYTPRPNRIIDDRGLDLVMRATTTLGSGDARLELLLTPTRIYAPVDRRARFDNYKRKA